MTLEMKVVHALLSTALAVHVGVIITAIQRCPHSFPSGTGKQAHRWPSEISLRLDVIAIYTGTIVEDCGS